MKPKWQLFFIIFLLLFALWQRAFGQTILNNYIKRGLDSNLAIKQQNFDLQNAKLNLERAKTLFYPQAQVNAQYTLASGGRSIDIPIGDLLNNVYSSLNQLTSSSKFPQVQNQSIQFLPNNFHDTKVEVTMPVYNASLQYNKKIKEEQINTQQQSLNLYKRELVFNIKQAYYQYLQATKAVAVYNNALATVNENLRYSEKLVKNQVATKEVTLKARTEVSKVQTALADAESNQKNAEAYFNFLLNQSLETPVVIDSSLFQPGNRYNTIITVDVPQSREELKQISSTQQVLETNLRLNNTYKLPTLNGFYNIGFQGFGYHLNDKQFYQLGGLQLTWNLFKANDNKLKAKQTEIDIEAIKNQYKNVSQQLMLQVVTTYNQYQSSVTALHNANDEVTSTHEAYRLTQSRYQQGEALQIELIDARTQMTNADISLSLAQLAVFGKEAELERVIASYPLP